MGSGTVAAMTLHTILKLGRVSNLPTVWTNAAAGMALAGIVDFAIFWKVGIVLSLFYIGGMWLNDAFDAEIDAAERANRPIPKGEISRQSVFIVGYVLVLLGISLSFTLNLQAGLAGIVLAITVVLYDWLHKRTMLSPVIMGVTRFLCYVLAAVCVGTLTNSILFAAFGLFAYIVGLTYAAKQEAYDRIDRAWPLAVLAIPVGYSLIHSGGTPTALLIWLAMVVVIVLALRLLFRRSKGDVPKAVVTLIAGISLYDASIIAGAGNLTLAMIAVAGFVLTLVLQRLAPGT